MKKGFYFSMDAMMALLIMSASMTLVLQSSDLSSEDFTRETNQYREASTVSRDIMKIASVEKLGSLKSDYIDILKPPMEDSDLNKSLLDGITLLWAEEYRSEARNLTKKYFDSQVPESYEYKVEISDDTGYYTVYNSTEIQGQPTFVTSFSTLANSHEINQSYSPEKSEVWGPANIKLVIWSE